MLERYTSSGLISVMYVTSEEYLIAAAAIGELGQLVRNRDRRI